MWVSVSVIVSDCECKCECERERELSIITQVWNVNTQKEHLKLEGHKSGVNWVEYCTIENKKCLVSSSDDRYDI